MIRVVRASGLGVSSTSIAHTCPAYGTALDARASGSPRRGRGPCGRRRAARRAAAARNATRPGPGPRPGWLHPQPGGQDRPQVGQPSQRGPGGREPQPGRGHPVPGQPAPPRPRPQPARWPRTRRGATGPSARAAGPARPAARRRAGRTGRPSARRHSSSPSMSRWDSRMLPASARRRREPATGAAVSCACAVVFISAFPACTRVPGCPRVFTDARDVTIFPRGRDTARAADAS